jgi:hypothetical protein
MDRAPLGFGVAILLLGLGIGALMLWMPEGLNPNWPMGLALLAPGAFVLAGLHLVGSGLGYPRFSGVMLALIAIALWIIVNWAAFFTTQHGCVATVSFGGVSIFGWRPSEEACRMTLQMLVASFDGLLIVLILVAAWRRLRRAPEDNPSAPAVRHRPRG